VRADAVTRSTAVWWGLADGEVLPLSTGGVLGWRRAGGVEAGLTVAVARRAGAQRGVDAGVVADVGGEGVLVRSGAVDGRRGRELQVRCRGGEGKSWRRGEGAEGAAVGVGECGRCVEETGARAGGSLPTSGWRPAGRAQDRQARATCAVGARPAEHRGRGEADRWALGTVSGGGTDR
jgi:hypothetical protein